MTGTRSLGGVCKGWWETYIAAGTGTARRSRAKLRRSATVTDALGVSATHELNRRLVDAGYDLRKLRDGPDRLALVSITLAHVMHDQRETAARTFGAGEPKMLSGLRFEALIRATEPRALIRPLVRALRLAGGRANVARLANDLCWWNDRTRTNWCFDYYSATDATPDLEGTTR